MNNDIESFTANDFLTCQLDNLAPATSYSAFVTVATLSKHEGAQSRRFFFTTKPASKLMLLLLLFSCGTAPPPPTIVHTHARTHMVPRSRQPSINSVRRNFNYVACVRSFSRKRVHKPGLNKRGFRKVESSSPNIMWAMRPQVIESGSSYMAEEQQQHSTTK